MSNENPNNADPIERREFDHRHVARLTIDSDPWLSCDDCFEQVDSVVEGVVAENIPLSAPFRVHLAACPVCHEEAVSLAELIAEDFNLSPEQAVARLEAAVEGAAA